MNRALPFRISAVTLAGFGVYERPVRFEFPDGPAVLVAPNEAGKSTLVHGLTAVLFGLRTSSDPARFGTARFRSLSKPGDFWGELEWEADGSTWRLRRDFESHRVLLTREEAGRRRILFEGTHNPGAVSSDGTAFPPVLRERLGIADGDLFHQTFCLSQPLPGTEEVGEELRSLLSGSRSGPVEDVLGRIFGQVRTLTRRTGDLGILRPGTSRPTNQREDGAIESLEAAMVADQTLLDEGRVLLERLNARSEERDRIEEEQKNAAREETAARLRLQVLESWLAGDEERTRLQEEAVRLGEAKRRLEKIDADRAAVEESVPGGLAAFAEAPTHLATLLERFEEALEDLEKEQEDSGRSDSARGLVEEEVRQLEERLEREFAGVRGRPDLPEIRRRLETAKSRTARRAERIVTVQEELAGLQAQVPEDTVGPPDPSSVRAGAAPWIAAASRLAEIDRRVTALAGKLEARRALGEAGLGRLRTKVDAENRIRDLTGRIREAEERRRAHESRRAEAAPAPSHASGVRPWLGVLAGAALAATLHFGRGLEAMPSLVAGAVLFALVLLSGRLIGGKRNVVVQQIAGLDALLSEADADLDRLRSERSRLQADAEALRHELGPFAATSAAELVEFDLRWKQSDEEISALEAERAALLEDPLWGDPAWRERPLEDLPEEARRGRELPWAPETSTVGPLIEWLASLTEVEWAALDRTAGDREAAATRIEAVRDEIQRLQREDEEDDEVALLEVRLAPFDEAISPEELEARLAECASVEESLRAARQRLSETPDPQTRGEKLRDLDAEAAAARAAVAAAWPMGEDRLPMPSPAFLPQVQRLRETEREGREAWQRARALEETRQGILDTTGCSSELDLDRRRVEADAHLGQVAAGLRELESGEPLLAGIRGIGDPVRRARSLHDLREAEEQEMSEAARRLEEAKAKEHEILKDLAGLEGRQPANLAQVEIRMQQNRKVLASLKEDRDALVQAWLWTREASDEFRSSYRDDLQERIDDWFRVLTGVEGRRVEVDGEFRIAVIDAAGHLLASPQLSQGARDQLSLAVRLAVADLLAATVPLPLLLDDPFVHFDAARLENLRGTLARIAGQRQWILLTHREEMAEWAGTVRSRPAAAA